MGVLEGKVFILVGSGRGVGRAVAMHCAREGASLIINDTGCALDGAGHDPNVAAEVAANIVDQGGRALASHVDASSRAGLQALTELARTGFGSLDGGAYFAVTQRERALLRMSDEEFESVLEIELFGAFRFVQHLSKSLIELKRPGTLLLGTGPGGYLGHTRQCNAAAAAGGVLGLVRSSAAELKKHRIRVNGLAPTARTRTTAHLPLFQTIRTDSLTPEHVAPVATHLLSEAADDISGEIFGVAGGRIYAFRVSETTGLYSEGPPATLETLKKEWRAVTRG